VYDAYAVDLLIEYFNFRGGSGPTSVSALSKSDSSHPRGMLEMKRVSLASAIVTLT
jgi:hypothetical protein